MQRKQLVTLILVTESRGEFLPWWAWNINQQSYDHCEVIVVDSTPRDAVYERLLHDTIASLKYPAKLMWAEPGDGVGCKMRQALLYAHGDYIAKLDDDDWHHPRRIAEQVAMADGAQDVIPAAQDAYFHSIYTRRSVEYRAVEPVLALSLVPRIQAKTARWTDRPRGSDTVWIREVMRGATKRLYKGCRGVFLVHGYNLNHEDRARTMRRSFEHDLREAFPEWTDETEHELAMLKERLRCRKLGSSQK